MTNPIPFNAISRAIILADTNSEKAKQNKYYEMKGFKALLHAKQELFTYKLYKIKQKSYV
jgi:hypothetical protein